MDLQKSFPKSAIDLKIPCTDSAETRFDSCNVSDNVLRNCALSFASCNSSWSLCVGDHVFSKCFRLLTINFGTWFSSNLGFSDELCFVSSSITESVYTFDRSSTRLTSFDAVEFNTDDDDDKEAADEVALIIDEDFCSSLNELASTPNDKGSVDAEPHIWTNLFSV